MLKAMGGSVAGAGAAVGQDLARTAAGETKGLANSAKKEAAKTAVSVADTAAAMPAKSVEEMAAVITGLASDLFNAISAKKKTRKKVIRDVVKTVLGFFEKKHQPLAKSSYKRLQSAIQNIFSVRIFESKEPLNEAITEKYLYALYEGLNSLIDRLFVDKGKGKLKLGKEFLKEKNHLLLKTEINNTLDVDLQQQEPKEKAEVFSNSPDLSQGSSVQPKEVRIDILPPAINQNASRKQKIDDLALAGIALRVGHKEALSKEYASDNKLIVALLAAVDAYATDMNGRWTSPGTLVAKARQTTLEIINDAIAAVRGRVENGENFIPLVLDNNTKFKRVTFNEYLMTKLSKALEQLLEEDKLKWIWPSKLREVFTPISCAYGTCGTPIYMESQNQRALLPRKAVSIVNPGENMNTLSGKSARDSQKTSASVDAADTRHRFGCVN